MKEYPSWTGVTRRILVGCAVAATLVAAAWVEENIRGAFDLGRFEKKCADEGKPLTLAFYKPAPIPDGENFFRAPVLDRFFNAHETSGEAWSAYESGKPPVDQLSKVLGNWMQGQGSDFTKAYAALGQAPQGREQPSSEAGARLVLETLKGVGPDLDAIDRAARERKRSQIEIGENNLPPFRVLRFFTRALNLRAAAEIKLGQTEKAYDDLLASLHLADGVERFPHHISLMMANAMAAMSIQPTWEGCVRGAWSESQLAGLQQGFSNIHVLHNLPLAFAAGRAAYEAGYLSNRQKPWWMPLGWWKMNIVRLFDLHLGGGDPHWLDPDSDGIELAAIERSDALQDKLGHSRSPFDWLIRHEAWGKEITIFAALGQSRLEMTQTACALERYRLAHGDYPAELSDLVPAFLEGIPRDVIDHAPLRYERAGEGRFRLYSIGLSGIDAQAWPAKPDLSSSSSPEGYWVWAQSGSLGKATR